MGRAGKKANNLASYCIRTPIPGLSIMNLISFKKNSPHPFLNYKIHHHYISQIRFHFSLIIEIKKKKP